jgi:hypothetical protein
MRREAVLTSSTGRFSNGPDEKAGGGLLADCLLTSFDLHGELPGRGLDLAQLDFVPGTKPSS